MNINTLAWLYACQNPEDDKGYALSKPLPFTTTKLFRNIITFAVICMAQLFIR